MFVFTEKGSIFALAFEKSLVCEFTQCGWRIPIKDREGRKSESRA